MVREVGFSDEDGRSTVADRVLDEHRARHRARKIAAARDLAEQSADTPSERSDGSRSIVHRTVTFIFLSLWLAAWTVAIVFVGNVIVSGPVDDGFATLFLVVWEAVAVFAWYKALRNLIKMVRGR